MSVLQVTGLGFILLSIICCVISLATDYWVSGPEFHMGLWNLCKNKTECSSLPQLEFPPHRTDYTAPIVFLDCARAASILTLIFLVAAVVVQSLVIWFNNRLKVVRKQKLTSGFVFLGVTAEIAGLAIFRPFPGFEVDANDLELSWSYFLGWASAGFSIVAGLVAMYSFA
ncbi:hypothetical protein NDU88_010809 [Pleurodeles waltl]|uniref:Uncharacterized protein n=1 Tax=Pleurodeles waltl TaxID=8319 RepID=A0AAV7Q3A4_PLEWA|nr:hypothetical protein NDU88_010809 [Pleurodeles waltl]